MKRLRLFLAVLLIVSGFVPCLTVMAQPNQVPHEDPSAAQSKLDSFSFLTQYAQIFALIAAKDYANASRLSEFMSHITVPADLVYIVNRYNNLTQQFIGVLNNLQNTLDNASKLLSQYRLNEAGKVLDQAGVLVAQAQILLGQLQDATVTLSQNFGVFASTAQTEVRQAYDELQSVLQRLNDLINQYLALLQAANQRAQDIESQNLEPTSLSLGLDSTKSYIGGSIGASGVLSSNSQVLGGRVVQLLLNGQQVGTANTQADGSYSFKFQVPFSYVDSVSVTALYTPLGNDRGVYLAALSPTIKVQVLFYKTILNVSLTSVAYPGLPCAINGQVTSDNGPSPNARKINILLDNASVIQIQSGANGLFTTTFTVDPAEKLGTHALAVTVDPSGLYSGASLQKTLTVEKMRTSISVGVPSFIILPSQIQVTGKVGSALGPSAGINILVDLGNVSANVRTSTNGNFNATLNLPINLLLAGFQDVSVSAQPSVPWQAAGQTKVSVFALNSVSVGVVLTSSLSVFFVAFKRASKTRSKKSQQITIPVESTPTVQMAEIGFSSTPHLSLEGNRGLVLKAYVDALRILELVTGNSLLPNMTLREFAVKTEDSIGEAKSAFSELTTLAEKSLYSPHDPREEDLGRAQNLVREVGRFLSNPNT